MITNLLEKLEQARPFTDKEAWNLFRLAAIGEAIGWSLLISGILIKRYLTRGNNIPVIIAGQIHGTIFLIYIAAVLVLYSSLRWSRKRTIIAGLASIPPYGSLVFEQWAAHKRQSEALKTYREITVRALIIQKDRVLAVQPKDRGFWNVPGGTVTSNETVEQALARTVKEQTGILPSIDRLSYILQYREKSTEKLELFFVISNVLDFKEEDLKKEAKRSKAIDEISYIKPEENADLKPTFLQTEHIVDATKTQRNPVIILS